MTYRELDERANQLARRLKALGVRRETLIGLCLDRSPELIVGMLGILKAGGAYVPMDPSYPDERLAFILKDAGISLVVAHGRTRGRIPRSVVNVVCLDADRELLTQESASTPDYPSSPDQLAYVIYTSGSTGNPKGVQICHKSVTHLFEVTRHLLDFTTQDVWTVFHSYAFDLSVWEIWGCLVHGGKLIVVSKDVASSPRDFFLLLCQEGVTVVSQTPSALSQLVHFLHADGRAPKTETSLRAIVCGGEALPVSLARAVLEWNVPLWNFYGPTEATVWVTAGRVELADLAETIVPIGHPFHDVKAMVLDRNGHPVPEGEVGELLLGGVCLARGYLNRPELTARTFIRDPFQNNSEARFYKTGDLARLRPDGQIELLGRMDHQIKLNGFRIELGEIEAAINQHPGVRESVVIARSDGPEDQRLAAYFVRRNGHPCPATALRSFLLEKLPAYMVPFDYLPMAAIPLTPNGKIDRKALPSFSAAASDEASPPVSLRHQDLIEIWEQVLGITPIGIHDSFLDLGGRSLTAVEIAVAIERKCGVRVPLGAAFEFPTIAKLTERLMARPISDEDAHMVRMNPSGTRQPIFFMNGMVELARFLGPDQPFYGLNIDLPETAITGQTAIEDMARRSVSMIRRIQPRGPYQLGGYSLGGPVAFEICHQLHLQGEKTTLLVLVDPDPPRPSPEGAMRRRLSQLTGIARNLMQLEMSQKLAYVVECTRRGRARMSRASRTACEPNQEPTFFQRMESLNGCYQPPTVPCHATLVLATHQSKQFKRPARDPRVEWRKAVTEGADIFQVTGDHASLQEEPQLRRIAEFLKARLSLGLAFSSCGVI